MRHEHPLKILRYCIKNLWLLIFPLLRTIQLFPFSPEALIAWFLGAWFDILIFLLILGIAFLRWYCFRFDFHEEEILCEKGLLTRRHIRIDCQRITSITAADIYLIRPLKLITLKIDIGTGTFPFSEIRLWLRQRDYIEMCQKMPVLQSETTPSRHYRPGIWLTLLFSFLFSSSLSGTVYFIAFFFRAGSIARDLFQEFHVKEQFEKINQIAVQTFHVIPAVIVTICVLFGAFWLISFFTNLLHYGRFHVHVGKDFLSVHMGILTRHRTKLRPRAVNFVIFRQNLMMKIFGVYSIHLSCPGYGSGRKSLPVLIPVVTKKGSPLPLSVLMPDVSDQTPPKMVHGKIAAFWSFLWQPVMGISAVLLAAVDCTVRFPAFRRLIFFTAMISLIPAVWMLLIRLISIPSEYVRYDAKQIQLHYSRGFSFYTITAPLQHVVGVRICKTILSKQGGFCNLWITLNGQHQHQHRLIGVPIEQAEALLAFVAAQQTADALT